MILPRPVPSNCNKAIDYKSISDFISSHFTFDESFTLVDDANEYKFKGIVCGNSGNYIITNRRFKIGSLKFYTHVTKDIGYIESLFDDDDKPIKLKATTWLFMGIDGRLNIYRLCEAMAKNGELLPLTNPIGQNYAAILKESNDWIREDNDEKDILLAIEHIDHHLVKYNTYLEQLAQRSGVKLKQ